MKFDFNLFFNLFKRVSDNKSKSIEIKKELDGQENLDLKKIADHEAAHGIVWYLFRDNWIVNKLTIVNDDLPDQNMRGALHISANFDAKTETNIQRINELFTIALAGMIGQNLSMIYNTDNLLFLLTRNRYYDLFDISGCGGDFELAKKNLPSLGDEFQISEANFTKFKIMDLVTLFQEDYIVQNLHQKLSNLLLEKKTLTNKEITDFFESHNFSEHILDEGLDINFFNQS
jgi:hypothetical protein